MFVFLDNLKSTIIVIILYIPFLASSFQPHRPDKFLDSSSVEVETPSAPVTVEMLFSDSQDSDSFDDVDLGRDIVHELEEE